MEGLACIFNSHYHAHYFRDPSDVVISYPCVFGHWNFEHRHIALHVSLERDGGVSLDLPEPFLCLLPQDRPFAV